MSLPAAAWPEAPAGWPPGLEETGRRLKGAVSGSLPPTKLHLLVVSRDCKTCCVPRAVFRQIRELAGLSPLLRDRRCHRTRQDCF